MDNKRAFFISILLLIALACIVPGLAANSVSAPTEDTRLQVMVAETVAVAITQTAQAAPPTFTPMPTATSTPAPTATSTALPVGSSLTKQENGSTLFTDERAGYAITIPEGWLAVRIKEQEFFDALTLTELSDPLVHESLTKIRDEDPNILRLFAVDVQDETVQNEPVTTIKIIWDELKDVPFNSDNDLQIIADELTKTIQGLEVTSIDIMITPTQITFGIIESKTTGSDGVITFQKRVLFKASTGYVNVTLTTGTGLKEGIIPMFDTIADTIKISGQ